MNWISIPTQVRQALERIARESRTSVDAVLDLFLSLSERRAPGECMQCFFALHGRVPAHCRDDLAVVRQWLQERVEVVAENGERTLLAKLPCEIRETSLEDYCRRLMKECAERFRDVSRLQLSFHFKGSEPLSQ